MIVFNNEKFVEGNLAKVRLADYCFQREDGIFETILVKDGKIQFADDHIIRLFSSTKLVGIKINYRGQDLIFIAGKIAKVNKIKNGILRIFVTRGGSIHANEFQTKLFMLITKMGNVMKNTENGVRVVSFRTERIFPEAKTLCFLPNIIAAKYAKSKNAFEALLVNRNGFVTEATSSNLFIIKNKILITPKDEILKGITRGTILKISKELIKVRLRPIKLHEIYEADEVFLTNSIDGVIPVTAVDSKKIGNGKPGKFSCILHDSYTNLN